MCRVKLENRVSFPGYIDMDDHVLPERVAARQEARIARKKDAEAMQKEKEDRTRSKREEIEGTAKWGDEHDHDSDFEARMAEYSLNCMQLHDMDACMNSDDEVQIARPIFVCIVGAGQ